MSEEKRTNIYTTQLTKRNHGAVGMYCLLLSVCICALSVALFDLL